MSIRTRKEVMKDDLAPSYRPTMADVAREAGVSKMTVSRALSGGRIAEETHRRIATVIKALGYVPDASAGALARGRSGFVAAVIPTLSNSNFADTARGLMDALAPAGLQPLFGFTEYRPQREEELVRAMLAHRPEAVLLTGADHAEETRSMLRRAALPVVETWEVPTAPLDMSVGFSNAEAGRLMVRHLAARGYKRIGFISGESSLDQRGSERERGYREALAETGLGPPRVIHHGMPPLSMEQGSGALLRLVAKYPDCDAVFCVSDLLAFGAIMACHREGWAVPGRLAIAGFGDFEIARCCHPRITTLGVDAFAIGQRAGQALLEAIGHKSKARVPRHTEIPIAVLPREST
jgi:LacI family gluconate utilization system Gnt-I transcriptional repressor